MPDRFTCLAGALLGVALVTTPGSARSADWQSHLLTRWEGTGATGNATSGLNVGVVGPLLSADGRTLAFDSNASNLIAGEPAIYTNVRNAFLADAVTGAAVLASHAAGAPTRPANGQSGGFALSGDGRFLLLGSYATDLVTGIADTNEGMDVFVVDRDSGAIDLVSVAVGGTSTGADVSVPLAISADGDTVVFRNGSNDMLVGVSEGTGFGSPGLYLRRRSTGRVHLVNHLAGAPLAPASGWVATARLSADGRYVVYTSTAAGLVAGVEDFIVDTDVFLYDSVTDTTVLVSHDPANPSLATGANALLAVDPGAEHVLFSRNDGGWLYDRASGALSPIPGGFYGVLSGDARFVAYGDAVAPPGVIAEGIEFNVYLIDRHTGAKALLSHAAGVPQHTANGRSLPVGISADGRRVLFVSSATDLVAGQQDDNHGDDLFVYDRSDASVRLVSSAFGSDTRSATQPVLRAALSADGRTALFTSAAPDLLSEPDLNEVADAITVDLELGTRQPLSRATVVRPAALGGYSLGASTDARWLLYSASVAGSAAGSGAATFATYLVDADSRRRILFSHRVGDPTQLGYAQVYPGAVLTGDGAYVGFAGFGTDLAPDSTDALSAGLFLYERASGARRLVSHRAGDPSRRAGGGQPAAFSPDGRYLVYSSGADELVPDGRSGQRQQALLYDRIADASFLLSGSRGSRSVGADDGSRPLALSDDGRYVLLVSQADDLIAGLTLPAGPRSTLYLRDRETKRTWLVSHHDGDPTAAIGDATPAGMSADGRYVLFDSRATGLDASDDTNQSTDVFVWDRLSDRSTLVSRRTGAGAASSNGVSTAKAISADGRWILFDSTADDLVAGATSGHRSQVYLADRERGQIALVSHSTVSTATGSALGSTARKLSRDGRCAVFESASTDLAGGAGLKVGNLYRWCRDRPIQRISEPVAPVHAPNQGSVSASAIAISPDGARVLYESSSGALDAQIADPNSGSDVLVALHQDDLFRDEWE